MTVIRTVHNKENPYVQLNKKALNDPNLSLHAIGLWARCMSRPDDWVFCIKEMVSRFKEGKAIIYKCINELIKHGYALKGQRTKQNDGSKKGGKRFLFDSVDYLFFEFQITAEEKAYYEKDFQKLFPLSDFQLPQVTLTQNQPLLNTDSLPNTEEDLLLKPPEIPVPPDPLPAGGNNNNSPVEIYKCLEPVNDMSPKQKSQFGRYDEKIVEAGVSYCYHPNTKLQGPQARIKQLHAYCQNPADYADTLKHLDNPKKDKESYKDKVLNTFVKGELYNGFEFFADDYGAGFIVPSELRVGDRHTWGFAWKDTNWYDEFLKIREKINKYLKSQSREPR